VPRNKAIRELISGFSKALNASFSVGALTAGEALEAEKLVERLGVESGSSRSKRRTY